jgi:dephospho-CoA kinase
MSTDARVRRPKAQDDLFVIGVVGRAGSGKTTVARVLTEGGGVVIEADRIGHQVTDQDPEVRAALVAEYGPEVYLSDGTLDRARVAARVFTDDSARARLDRLVHPRILTRIRGEIDGLRASGYRGIVVIDAALMLEWGLERECDAIVAVTAPEHTQVERLEKQRGWSATEARARLAAQRSNEAFAAAADVTLENQGAVEALVRATREAVGRLRSNGKPKTARKDDDADQR